MAKYAKMSLAKRGGDSPLSSAPWVMWVIGFLILGVIAYAVYAMTSKSYERFVDAAESSESINSCDNTKKPYTLIFFSMDTCPHCKDFEPTWSQFESYAATNGVLSTKVCMTRVSAQNRGMCQKYNVTGFPTVTLVNNKSSKTTEFRGARTLESLKSFVLQNAA